MTFSDERMKLRGRLAEAEQKKKDLEIRHLALRRTIRAEMDLYGDPLDMNVLEAADQMKLLLDTHREYSEVTALVERLRKDLGE